MKSLKIVIAQFENIVGDIEGNADRIIKTSQTAYHDMNADLVIFPELALTGYPPEDLLLRPGLHRRVAKAKQNIQQVIKDIDIIYGLPQESDGNIFNSATFLHQGEYVATYHKQKLPNYLVFDEKRYFTPGLENCVLDIKGFRAGLLICEDLWEQEPIQHLINKKLDFVIVINASPFHREKHHIRMSLLQERCAQIQTPIFYVHCVGGQDELVFDGGSLIALSDEQSCFQLPFFESALVPFRIQKNKQKITVTCQNQSLLTKQSEPNECEMVYRALVTGLRSYIERNNFPGAYIGLSGGIDSALALAVAVDAIGAENVEAVAMPSQFSADESYSLAQEQCKQLKVNLKILPIESLYTCFLSTLQNEFAALEHDITEQNLQARIRGTLLMALSNKFGKIVLTTGNKSELAVGYSTLYGDMAGGFAVLKDVFKMQVYQLANYRNSLSQEPVIPLGVINRKPTAELAPNQLDSDHLPEYHILDRILEYYVEQDLGIDEIVAEGFDLEIVYKVLNLVDRNEYKRRQAPPGVRVSRRNFGRDRRYPITSSYWQNRSKRLFPAENK